MLSLHRVRYPLMKHLYPSTTGTLGGEVWDNTLGDKSVSYWFLATDWNWVKRAAGFPHPEKAGVVGASLRAWRRWLKL